MNKRRKKVIASEEMCHLVLLDGAPNLQPRNPAFYYKSAEKPVGGTLISFWGFPCLRRGVEIFIFIRVSAFTLLSNLEVSSTFPSLEKNSTAFIKCALRICVFLGYFRKNIVEDTNLLIIKLHNDNFLPTTCLFALEYIKKYMVK